jgi:hypothetical protein
MEVAKMSDLTSIGGLVDKLSLIVTDCQIVFFAQDPSDRTDLRKQTKKPTGR